MTDLSGAEWEAQPFVLKYRLCSWLSLAASLAFLATALAAPASPIGRGCLGFFFVVFGCFAVVSFRTTYEVNQDRLTVRGVITRRTIVLSELASAETFRKRSMNGRPQAWGLLLYDRQGTAVRMNFDGSSPARRRRLLNGLAPCVMASGVHRSGQIENALAGVLWTPSGVPSPRRGRSRRPLGVRARATLSAGAVAGGNHCCRHRQALELR
jgi:hypothetical protein